jgi:hypothetical protein
MNFALFSQIYRCLLLLLWNSSSVLSLSHIFVLQSILETPNGKVWIKMRFCVLAEI